MLRTCHVRLTDSQRPPPPARSRLFSRSHSCWPELAPATCTARQGDDGRESHTDSYQTQENRASPRLRWGVDCEIPGTAAAPQTSRISTQTGIVARTTTEREAQLQFLQVSDEEEVVEPFLVHQSSRHVSPLTTIPTAVPNGSAPWLPTFPCPSRIANTLLASLKAGNASPRFISDFWEAGASPANEVASVGKSGFQADCKRLPIRMYTAVTGDCTHTIAALWFVSPKMTMARHHP